MLAPAKPDDESTQIPALKSLAALALEPTPDERFDGLARLARRHFGVPLALIVADGRPPRFKSCVGFSLSETPRILSFLERAGFGGELLVVPDTLADARLNNHPLVVDQPCYRFYAGCRLVASDGTPLGRFCLVDSKPRELDDEDCDYLRDLARLAATILEHDRIEASQKEIATILPPKETYILNTSEFDQVKSRLAVLENRHKVTNGDKGNKPTLRRTSNGGDDKDG